MVDLLDFRLSRKIYIKIKVFMGFLPKYNGKCKRFALLYCAIFIPVALIVVEKHAFLHCTLLLLILCKF